MRLNEAHSLAKGDNVLVAVIDSGIDANHPELAGSVADSLDTVQSPFAPHDHGTGIAALIAGRERLTGASPGARILAVRAFDPAGSGAEATTFSILKGLDWSAAKGARIINMSFAGPADPAISRSLAAARKKNIILIAAAGNAGAKSPPLYPAADPNVIAVTATDSADKLFQGSNRGRHIAVAAPGVDVLIAVPNGGYQVSTGTSFSAAQVSGTVALMLQHKGAAHARSGAGDAARDRQGPWSDRTGRRVRRRAYRRLSRPDRRHQDQRGGAGPVGRPPKPLKSLRFLTLKISFAVLNRFRPARDQRIRGADPSQPNGEGNDTDFQTDSSADRRRDHRRRSDLLNRRSVREDAR